MHNICSSTKTKQNTISNAMLVRKYQFSIFCEVLETIVFRLQHMHLPSCCRVLSPLHNTNFTPKSVYVACVYSLAYTLDLYRKAWPAAGYSVDSLLYMPCFKLQLHMHSTRTVPETDKSSRRFHHGCSCNC